MSLARAGGGVTRRGGSGSGSGGGGGGGGGGEGGGEDDWLESGRVFLESPEVHWGSRGTALFPWPPSLPPLPVLSEGSAVPSQTPPPLSLDRAQLGSPVAVVLSSCLCSPFSSKAD